MRTPFEGWDGCSVPELIKGALQYSADYDYDEEVLLKEIAAEHPIALVRDQMRTLIGLCRAGGMDLAPFDARPDASDGGAA
ncbi:hypothetical protein [Bradyrhizobium sp. DASA03007]|uniref:hypothetical protein n=1 Tax=unclassified Bradyrhizobium TaxID=2631580 RepID=UPI003F6EF889